jgi:hypothetical protein
MTQQLSAGETTYMNYGPTAARITLVVRVDMHHDGVSITVVNPARTTLNRAFTNLGQGRAYLRYLRDAAKAGQPVWQIEAGAGVLTSTTTVMDDAEQDLIDRLNADLDADVAEAVAVNNTLIADRDNILADADRNWRDHFRAEVVQAHRGQSTAAPTTDPMDRVLTAAANTDGRIVRGGQPGRATSTQLIALRKRGLVELVYGKRRNQRVIVEGRLTVKGYKHTGVETMERAA